MIPPPLTPEQRERVRALENFIHQSSAGLAGGHAFLTTHEDGQALTAALARLDALEAEARAHANSATRIGASVRPPTLEG